MTRTRVTLPYFSNSLLIVSSLTSKNKFPMYRFVLGAAGSRWTASRGSRRWPCVLPFSLETTVVAAAAASPILAETLAAASLMVLMADWVRESSVA